MSVNGDGRKDSWPASAALNYAAKFDLLAATVSVFGALNCWCWYRLGRIR
jgi:hypothetical protein